MSESCRHCWHVTGVVVMTEPPKVQQYCCLCGVSRNIVAQKSEDPTRHGIYLRKQLTEDSKW